MYKSHFLRLKMCFFSFWVCESVCGQAVCVCVCVSVDGQLPAVILICQCNSLPSLIFNKAPGELQTSSSELSICYFTVLLYFWIKLVQSDRQDQGRGSNPNAAVMKAVNSLRTNGLFFFLVSQTLRCNKPMVRAPCLVSEHRQVEVSKSGVYEKTKWL